MLRDKRLVDNRINCVLDNSTPNYTGSSNDIIGSTISIINGLISND